MAKILVIEDQLLWQRTLAKVLEQGGYEVVIAGSYQEAQSLLRETKDVGLGFDLIVLDFVLDEWGRELRGADLLPLIHERNKSGKSKVLLFREQKVGSVLTAAGDDALIQHKAIIIGSYNKRNFGDGVVFLETVKRALALRIAGTEGRFQNLQNFTVQIRVAGSETIAGTGIIVATDGNVVTCAHVVEEAVGIHPREAKDKEVEVYFPKARSGEIKEWRAAVAACLAQHDDDVVLLEPVEVQLTLGQEHVAVFGNAEDSQDNAFRAYGYSRQRSYISDRAHGIILGEVEPGEEFHVLKAPVQAEYDGENRGLTGAPVLDTKRNLVVGLISDRVFSQKFAAGSTSWIVNAGVLELEPFCLPVRKEPLPLTEAPQPKTDIEEAKNAVAPELEISWNNPPAPLPEWVGREDLLKALDEDWDSPERRMTGLIGFGGEGKSSLTRKWVDKLWESETRPAGVFWWGFYAKDSVDDFLEAALRFMSAGKIDSNQYPSASAKANLLGGMLQKGSYLFVLDGFEVMQHEEGDRYGSVKHDDLREFLNYFSSPGAQSFCLISSRIPVFDIENSTTYVHHDVSHLSLSEGCALLKELGVTGDDEALGKVVNNWGGHALTLTLLAKYLVEEYEGDAAYIDAIPKPGRHEARYERVNRILRHYDKHLTEAEQAFLMIFSAFRKPVPTTAFASVFRAKVEREGNNFTPINTPVTALDETQFEAMLRQLESYRILHYNPDEKHYTTHPLIREHYQELLNANAQIQIQELHQRIKDYYLSITGKLSPKPSLEDLSPLIEAEHHACCSGAYDKAYDILQNLINQGDRYVVPDILGAWETYLTLLLEFFPDGDVSQEPQVSALKDRSSILHEVGFCMQCLGHLDEAVSFYKHSIVIDLETKYWLGASRNYANLAELYAYTGMLDDSEKSAREELVLACRTEDKEQKIISLSDQAWVAYLRGNLKTAESFFGQAEALQREIQPQVRYLEKLEGIKHADYLRRSKNTAYARCVTESNLEICVYNDWRNNISRCHRLLGDLDSEEGQFDNARVHYDEAIKIARGIFCRHVLIEALLSHGRWAGRYLYDVSTAFRDLSEALNYAVNSGYRIYEVDIRVALVWTHLAEVFKTSAKNRKEALEKAKLEMVRARQISKKRDYYWGKVDAEEVEKRLDEVH